MQEEVSSTTGAFQIFQIDDHRAQLQALARLELGALATPDALAVTAALVCELHGGVLSKDYLKSRQRGIEVVAQVEPLFD